MLSFARLIGQGVDYERIDEVMEQFGWPMGPAYLNDVVGLDTAARVSEKICDGFPGRLQRMSPDPLGILVQAQRLGQKNGAGFYRYEADDRGRPARVSSAEAHELLAVLQPAGRCELPAQDIVERLMLPMILEAALCLHEHVVDSASDIDLAMLLGVGFPQYLGGPLKYADWLGSATVADRLVHHGFRVPTWFETAGPFYPVPAAPQTRLRTDNCPAAAG
jgi:3-hydroxyacyl-CoA dehydrogenase/enoyl-CoA hydratase/3-hydroxybutyryl-CoA epimerase/enoyl-CoA isomerase